MVFPLRPWHSPWSYSKAKQFLGQEIQPNISRRHYRKQILDLNKYSLFLLEFKRSEKDHNLIICIDNSNISIWMLYCQVQSNVLKSHFHLAPKLVPISVSANRCTNSKAGPSCSFTLINSHQVCFKYLLIYIFTTTAFSSWHPYQNTHELQHFPNISSSLQAISQSIHFILHYPIFLNLCF